MEHKPIKLAAIESSWNGIISDGPTFSWAAKHKTEPSQRRTSLSPPAPIPDDLTLPFYSLKEDHILLMQGATTGDERKPLLVGR